LASLIGPAFRIGTFAAMQRCHAYLHPYRSKEMKTLMSMLALAVALAFTGPAFAGDVTAATTQADCEKAGGLWDANTSKCSEKKS
jgi:phosphatidylglycerophosphate synthase